MWQMSETQSRLVMHEAPTALWSSSSLHPMKVNARDSASILLDRGIMM